MQLFRTAAALALATSLAACGTAPVPTQELAQTAASTDLAGVPNFHQVNDQLFRSGHVEDHSFAAIKSLGVRTVLSLETYTFDRDDRDEEAAATRAVGLGQVWDPMSGLAKPTLAEIEQALHTINDPALQPVLVHCRHGSDRTGIVVAAYRMTHDGWTKEQAVKEMRAYGQSIFLSWWDPVLDEVEQQGLTSP